ncbi:MAG: hypothetical protein LBD50_00070 [Rickettsiales bacterium]|jgi:hypothetical protein|nr:hypothetical protein [Rickettsiales bacterium]
MAKKLSMEEMINKLDSAKKANPLDLSSDQDLSIALMNLISLEEHFFFSGGKTGKTGFYDLIDTVREMRKELMGRIVKKSTAETGEVWCISKHLLAASMRLMEVGTKALGADKKKDAYDLFDKAYDLYSLFWGINMELIDLSDVKKIAPEVYEKSVSAKDLNAEKSARPETESKSVTKRLGEWVRKAVNCCIE